MSPPGAIPGIPAGFEVLVVERDERVLRGLERLLGEAGLLVTGQKEPQRALELFAHKHFRLAIVDHDTMEATTGIGLLAELRKRAPRTPVIVLVSKKTFESAVLLLRAGALDVIPKAPDQVGYLRERVLRAAGESRGDAQREQLLGEAATIHEEFLKRLLAEARQVKDLEDRLAGRPVGATVGEGPLGLLLCDARPFAQDLAKIIAGRLAFRVTVVQSGGEALDVAGGTSFQIAILGDELPDLPPTMVLRTLRAQSPELIAILLHPPGAGRRGSAHVVETTRQIPLLEAFDTPSDLAASLDELVEAFHAKNRERRYLQAFRERHLDFLRRYAELRQRIQGLLGVERGDGSLPSGILKSQVTPKPKAH